jgi:tetratricopeptide (TPR) repeat protein
MNFFKRMLGLTSRSTPASPSPDAIRLYDSDGQEYFIERDEYRSRVLPVQLEKAHGDPDQLYNALILALQDGFFAESVSPAEHLLATDSDRERSTTVLGIALTRSGRLAEAERLFRSYLEECEESGVILTNLAKVCADRGDEVAAEETLWRALAADPNQDNALDWWGALHRERDGDDGFAHAMQRVAELPGSWRAKLWLARMELEADRPSRAMALYESVLPVASEFPDALMMISGDLGSNGYRREALDLVGPVFDAAQHGPIPGINLAQACAQLGETSLGLRILGSLEQLGRHDLAEHLQQIRHELEAQ